VIDPKVSEGDFIEKQKFSLSIMPSIISILSLKSGNEEQKE
jgi:hypothetical protein